MCKIVNNSIYHLRKFGLYLQAKPTTFFDMRPINKSLPVLYIICLLIFTTCIKEEIERPLSLKLNISNDLVKQFYPSIDDGYSQIQLYESLWIKYNFPIDGEFTMSVDGSLKKFMVYNKIEGVRKFDELEWTIHNKDSLTIYPSSGNWFEQSEWFSQNHKIRVVSNLMVKHKDAWLYAQDKYGKGIRFNREFSIAVTNQIKSPYTLSVTELTKMQNNEFILPTSEISFMTNIPLDKLKSLNPYFQTRFVLIDVLMRNTTTNQPLEIEYEVIDDKIVKISNNSLEKLNKFEVTAKFIAQYDNGSGWQALGSEIQYKKEYTVGLYDNNDDFLLKYSYPCINQYHFLKDEYPKGYLRFSALPNGVNLKSIGKDYSILTRITALNSGEFVDADCSFTSDSLYFEYNMPSEFFENNQVYILSLHKLEAGKTSESLYHYHFRTSKFNNSLDKFNDFTNQWSYLQTISTGVHELNLASLGVTELFDYWESRTSKKGILQNSGLIQMEIIVEESSIFQISIYKNLYDLIALYPQSIKWRASESMGIPPRLKTGYVRSIYGEKHPGYLTPEIIAAGANPIQLDNSTSFRRNLYAHQLVRVVLNDYFDLRNYYASQGWKEPEFFIVWFLHNNLKFKVNYTLPGLNHVTNSTVFNFRD
jgi:hypothetical protein